MNSNDKWIEEWRQKLFPDKGPQVMPLPPTAQPQPPELSPKEKKWITHWEPKEFNYTGVPAPDEDGHWITDWQNKGGMEVPERVLTNYRFLVFIQGIPLGFSKIKNIVSEVETDSIVVGGINTYAVSLIKPTTKEKTMVFERGVTSGIMPNMKRMLASARFSVGQRLPMDIVIAVRNGKGGIEKLYFVHGAMVKSWKCSDLDAMHDEVLIESFEIVYETLEEQVALVMGAGLLAGLLGL